MSEIAFYAKEPHPFSKHGELLLSWAAVRCPNLECNDFTIDVHVRSAKAPPKTYGSSGYKVVADPAKKPLVSRRLRPEGSSVPQPGYIPKQIRDDYYEACLIRDLSPKAAATLARRCLQGIIRDFWGVTKNTLAAEITALKGQIDEPLWDAIDGLRKVGNIGAHMGHDVDKIIEIEPEEVAKLIGLIEILFKECYVARHERENSLRAIAALGSEKAKEQKK
ncbi:MAG: DUF4145 domain-containing protein [Acidobacteria bacterium]|nr:DUF4145 domain-containing protein [Acidobacteriota bacterium]